MVVVFITGLCRTSNFTPQTGQPRTIGCGVGINTHPASTSATWVTIFAGISGTAVLTIFGLLYGNTRFSHFCRFVHPGQGGIPKTVVTFATVSPSPFDSAIIPPPMACLLVVETRRAPASQALGRLLTIQTTLSRQQSGSRPGIEIVRLLS